MMKRGRMFNAQFSMLNVQLREGKIENVKAGQTKLNQ